MSDYLGPNQTRVLDSENRSFESVIYQKRKPPLSSEVNLTGKIDSDKNQFSMKYLIPSGWACVGDILNDNNASLYNTGTVLCNSSLAANTFKLVALDKGQDAQRNIAWVNGWRVLVQGSSSSDENNIIRLSVPPVIGTSHFADFVFLEVWRKLIDPSDVVYKYGNFLYLGTNPDNDLVDPAIGIETSLRIQIQYRIRACSSNLGDYPDGFDPTQVFVQGPLGDPISICDNASFSPVPGDPGLWRAGAGTDTAKEILQTVDGYTYAIPMFAVKRRNTGAYDPDQRSNGSARSLANYIAGYASDRPDNLYNDWVVADDILDMRHRVIPQENVKELCDEAFTKIINNDLPGKMTRLNLGEDSFNIYMVQPDAVSDVDKVGSTKIATGDGIRRVFSNAQQDQSDSFVIRTTNDKIIGTIGSDWTIGNAVRISASLYPVGSVITSIREVSYDTSTLSPSQYTTSMLPIADATVTLGNSPLTVPSKSYPLTIEYTIRYPSGPYGLSQVPVEFLESRKEDTSVSIAMQDMDIRVRNMGPVITTDGTKYNMLSNRGGRITEQYDFGHQMIFHTVGNGTATFSVPRDASGYNILGIAKISIGGSPYSGSTPTITRNANSYTVTLDSSVASGRDIEINLYTDNKFFEGNKQGRAITDCWEMKELTATGSGTVYHINSTDKAILAIASLAGENGDGYAYVGGGTRTRLLTNNSSLPKDSTKTALTINFLGSVSDPVEVPVLLHSAIGATEGYTFFYKTLPYQGLLDSSAITGVIEAVGPAITTTSGSGMITDYTYSQGTATFHDSTIVTGTGTDWANYVKPGYIIRQDATASKEYLITEVYDSSTLFIDVVSNVVTTPKPYTIISKDHPSFLQRNIIDLLPTYSSDNDSSGLNIPISTAVSDSYPILDTRIISSVQDIQALPPDTLWVGEEDTTPVKGRGRAAVYISDSTRAPLGLGNLGLKFEKITSSAVYKKTFQSYIINKENSGQLYLMVVGSETDNTSTMSCFFNHASNKDSVDIFELPGRPLVMRRIA